MFQWDKSINSMNVPACKVVHLFRSMREVQLALPGISAQQASAYLCQYQSDGGVCTVAVFHLHKSQVLAFYFGEPRIVPEQKTDSMLDQGLNFVESMGFLLTDQDLHLLEDADKEMLWSSLPIQSGLLAGEGSSAAPEKAQTAASVTPPDVSTPAVKAGVEAAASEEKETPLAAVAPAPVMKGTAVSVPVDETVSKEADAAAVDNVDDLLAAVEAMRAKRPGLRARKSPPSAEDMDRRRLQLRETVGRILASL